MSEKFPHPSNETELCFSTSTTVPDVPVVVYVALGCCLRAQHGAETPGPEPAAHGELQDQLHSVTFGSTETARVEVGESESR